MADAFSIKLDLSDIKRLEDQIKRASNSVPKSGIQTIANQAVANMKDSISSGLSPIAGNGRFPAYKTPERYPKQARRHFPAKRERPVNLELSGDMLANLTGRATDNHTIEIGYPKQSEAIKEQGHRDGANGQPRRPTIPQGSEQFTQTIRLDMEEAYAKLLDQAVELETNK